MILLYAKKISGSLLDTKEEDFQDIFGEKMSLLCEERRKRVIRMKQIPDKVRAVEAGLLLQECLREYLIDGIRTSGNDSKETAEECVYGNSKKELPGRSAAPDMKNLRIDYDKNGKPFLPDFPDVYFNISHSGEYVAVAVGDAEVGLDVQEKKELSDGVLKRIAAEEEKDLQILPAWLFSIKESFLKLTGDGITKDLRDFYIVEKNGEIFSPAAEEINGEILSARAEDKNRHLACYSCRFLDGEKYMLCLSTKQKEEYVLRPVE